MMLDHENRVSGIHEPIQHPVQPGDVLQVLAHRRLVQDVQCASAGPFAQLLGDLEPLHLTAGERVAGLAQHQVAQPHLARCQQRPRHRRLVAEQVMDLVNRHAEKLRQRDSM